MRMGAIFARGGCRALKWTAMLGVVFALGAGSAAAQNDVSIGIKSIKINDATTAGVVGEGLSTTVTVTLDKKVPAGENTTASAALTLVQDDGTSALVAVGEEGDAEAADLVLGQESLVFAAGTDTATTPLLTIDDLDAVDEKFRIRAVLSASGTITAGGQLSANTSGGANEKLTPATGKIDDDEVQTYELKATTAAANIKEGGVFRATLRASPNRPENEGVMMHIRAEQKDMVASIMYDVSGAATEIPAGVGLLLNEANLMHTLIVTAEDNDENRTDDPLTLTGIVGTVSSNEEVLSQDFTVLDIHQLPAMITGEAKDKDKGGETVMMVAEGEKAYLFVTMINKTVDRIFDTEEFTLTPVIAGGQALDARIMPANMEFSGAGATEGKKVVGPFTIEALTDEDIGMEDLMLSLDVAGDKDYGVASTSGMFSIAITDKTDALVSVKDDAYDAIQMALGTPPMLMTGEYGQIMTADLFDFDPMMVSVAFGASVEGAAVSASASGEMVMVMAEMAGEAKVTVTATATPMGDSLIISQTVSNVAQATFPVMVEDEPLTITLSGPEDEMMMNLTEGGMGGMVTVMLNRPYAMDIEVMVMRDRAASTAGDMDYELDPMMITIMAGEMMGSAMVMALEDDMMETVDNMPEALVLYGMAEGMEVMGEAKFYIWDMAVPALPLIAQLLLAGFLALGGYRRYLRR